MGKYYQKILTRQLTPLIWSSGLDFAFKPHYSGRGSILMFHRVIPPSKEPRIHNHLSLEIDPLHLEKVILYFRNNKNYDLIKLDDFQEWLLQNKNNHRRFVIFTFDDGYLDNLTYAYPVFKKWNVPFTIYVTTSLPDNHAVLWWYDLEEIIKTNSKVIFPLPDGKSDSFDCVGTSAKEKAFNQIRHMIMSFNEQERDENILRFYARNQYDHQKSNQKISLSWNDIQQLSEDPLVTIGAHTINHFNLCAITPEDAKKEIAGSGQIIESHIHKPVNHFSYPLGKYNSNLVQFCGEQGFATATTTKTANIFDKHYLHPFALPRIAVNALTTEKVLRLQMNGFFPAVLHKFKQIVT